jgi:hypothetical protein
MKKFLSDTCLHYRMVAARQKKFGKSYPLQVWGLRVAQMLRSVADQGRRA